MNEPATEPPSAEFGAQAPGRIEGGIDAIVIGAGIDGLAAATYLGKAGLHTVLVGGAGLGGRIGEREIAPGVLGVDGEHLLTTLDPEVIADLDLYRHGLSFAARRLDTTYFFDHGEALKFDGDLAQAAQLSLEDDDDREALNGFIGELLELAAYLRPAFEPAAFTRGENARRGLEKALGGAPPEKAALIQRYLYSSATDAIAARIDANEIRMSLLAEAAFRSGAAPHEPFSFMTYLRRLAGEAAGLQGAVAYPEGGAAAVVAALRRAAQAANVDMRLQTPVKSILVEGDRVGGVRLETGGQLRAPIVIAATDAQRVFLQMIGPAKIGIELQRMLMAERPEICTGRAQLVLKGVPQDDATRENMKRRLVYAPPVEAVTTAFLDARAGRVPEKMIIEAVFPGSLEGERPFDGRMLMSVMAHPLPFDAAPGDKKRKKIKKAVLRNIESFAGGLTNRIETIDIRLPEDEAAATGASPSSFAARPGIIRQWALAAATAASDRINGFYFCGPEAEIGPGISCSAARGAARAALRAYRKGAA